MELDEIREKKLAELKQRQLEQQQNQEKLADAEAQLNLLLRQVLEPEAKTRLNTIRLVNNELFLNAVQTIVYLANSKKLTGKISDNQLKALLEKISGEKKEIKIVRKGKTVENI